MRSFTLLVIALLILAPASAQDWVHPGSKLKFPAQIGSFVRGERSQLREGGVAVSYELLGNSQTFITLYAYRSRLSLEREMEEVQVALPVIWDRFELLEKKKVRTANRSGLRRRYHLYKNGEKYFSEARLYEVSSHFLKLRLTGPVADRAKLEKAAVQLVSKVLKR